LQAQQRSADVMAEPRQDGDLRHPFGVRVGLSLAAHHRDDAAPGTRLHGSERRRILSARRKLPHLRRICRLLPDGIAGAGTGDGGSSGMSERVLRIGLPLVTLAIGVLAWGLIVWIKSFPPYVLPGPGLVFSTLISDWAIL